MKPSHPADVIPTLETYQIYVKNGGEKLLPKAGTTGTSDGKASSLMKSFNAVRDRLDLEANLNHRIGGDTSEGEFSEAEQQEVVAGIHTFFNLELSDTGVAEAFLTDLGRSDLIINGEDFSRDEGKKEEQNRKRVEKMKGAVTDPRMLAAVTQVTHQGIFADALAQIFNSAKLPVPECHVWVRRRRDTMFECFPLKMS